jgi:hypothetical protein
MRERTWTAIISMGWALAGLQLLTVRWTPDCGGVAYGAPLPYVVTSLASSLEFHFLVAPFVLDLLTYAALLGLAARALLGWLGRRRGPRRRLLLVLLLPWVTVLHLGMMLGLRMYRPQPWAPARLHVYEWRSIGPYLGLPGWDSHVEPRCD